MSKLPSKRQMVQLNDERTSKKQHYDDIPIEICLSKWILVPIHVISTALMGSGVVLMVIFTASFIFNIIAMSILFSPFYLLSSVINRLY